MHNSGLTSSIPAHFLRSVNTLPKEGKRIRPFFISPWARILLLPLNHSHLRHKPLDFWRILFFPQMWHLKRRNGLYSKSPKQCSLTILQCYCRLHQFILYTGQLWGWGHLLPVKAIQRAYLVASLRQWEATSKPHVTVSEMIPIMMKNNVVTHSGGSRGGIQVLSRPWMVWHCRTRPTVRAPENT